VPDDRQAIRKAVMDFVADESVQVVLTTGGTGFSGRDVTPEAVEPLFDKRMDGFSVLFHQYSATTVGTSRSRAGPRPGWWARPSSSCCPARAAPAATPGRAF
jgi:molybdenum cofactor biosynthesis protein B